MDSVDDCLRRFCAQDHSTRKAFERKGAFSQQTHASIQASCSAVHADFAPAAQQHSRVFTGTFLGSTRSVFVVRDLLHEIRAALKNSLLKNEKTQKLRDVIALRKGSVLKTLMNSDRSKDKWIAAQRAVLQKHGGRAPGSRDVIKHVSFAPQRDDAESSGFEQLCKCVQATNLWAWDESEDVRR